MKMRQNHYIPLYKSFKSKVQKRCLIFLHYIYIYTGCPGRNVPDFCRMFLKLKYTDLIKKHLYPKLNGYGDNGERKV